MPPDQPSVTDRGPMRADGQGDSLLEGGHAYAEPVAFPQKLFAPELNGSTGQTAITLIKDRTLRRGALSGLVFLAGIGWMATESRPPRLLAPYYGSSTMIWANIIGLVLIALSLGYVLGGKVADRWPNPAC